MNVEKLPESQAKPLAMSIDHVKFLTGIGRTKIYEAINRGALKARKLGNKTLILQSDLEAFLNNLEIYSGKEVD